MSLFQPCALLLLHTFNGPLSGTTRVSRYQKGKTKLDFTEARDSEWQWHQLGHMQVCTSLQTDNHAITRPLSFLQAGCPSCRPTNSVKALKAQPRAVGCKRKLVAENQPGLHLHNTTDVRQCERISILLSLYIAFYACLQCFDAVGWAAGRASDL